MSVPLVAGRGLLVLAAALTVGVCVHESLHLLQAFMDGVPVGELRLHVNPWLAGEKCHGRLLCATPFPSYRAGDFLNGEGYPQTVHGIVIGEVWTGLLPWTLAPSANRRARGAFSPVPGLAG